MATLQLAEIPLGVCPHCGLMQFAQPHDHRLITTLTPAEAAAYWETRRGVYPDAPESR